MKEIYPLAFTPRFIEKPWGGRLLSIALGRALPPGRPFGESWEISAVPGFETPVADGPLAGRTIPQLAADARLAEPVFGHDVVGLCRTFFPLLLKFLDVQELLSVQVHPPGPRGATKSESWFVMRAEPSARVWRGWNRRVTEHEARAALAAGKLQDLIRQFQPMPGDVVDLPAGTIHAAGGGLLIAEIQESLDLTYRLFDWNRVDASGKPRELHVDRSFACVSWDRSSSDTVTIGAKAVAGGRRARLVANHAYELERWEIDATAEPPTDGHRFEILAIVSGSGSLAHDGGSTALAAGTCLLLPAGLGGFSLAAAERMTVLRSLPEPSAG
jgi:mannose-6-phosphate isomerase